MLEMLKKRGTYFLVRVLREKRGVGAMKWREVTEDLCYEDLWYESREVAEKSAENIIKTCDNSDRVLFIEFEAKSIIEFTSTKSINRKTLC